MENYKLSEKTQIDLTEIYTYGIEKFGLLQARKYFKEIEDILNLLSENKDLGRDASEFIPMLKRLSFKAHTIFYISISKEEIFIVRVLSQKMDYETNL